MAGNMRMRETKRSHRKEKKKKKTFTTQCSVNHRQFLGSEIWNAYIERVTQSINRNAERGKQNMVRGVDSSWVWRTEEESQK